MTEAYRIVSLALIAALACGILRSYAGGISAALSVTACVMVLLISMQFLKPIINILERLQSLTGLSEEAVAPMLKVTGIGILTQVCGTVCEDTGEKTLQSAVETGGIFLSLYVAAPLVSSVLDLLEEMLIL